MYHLNHEATTSKILLACDQQTLIDEIDVSGAEIFTYIRFEYPRIYVSGQLTFPLKEFSILTFELSTNFLFATNNVKAIK